MSRLIIHIGAPKTGSTALQYVLANNRDILESHSIKFHQLPNTLSACHWWFMLPFIDDYSSYMPAYNALKRVKSSMELRNLGLESMEAFIEECSRFDHVILSAEQFFFLPMPILEKFKQFADSMISDYRVISYIRNPVEAVRSEINQKIKSGATDLDQFIKSPPVYPIKKCISGYVDIFGKDSVTVRPYKRSALYGRDIVSDFTNTLFNNKDIDIKNSNEHQNRSLSVEALLIIYGFNHHVSRDDASGRRELLISKLEQIEGTNFDLPALLVEKIINLSQKNNDYLFRNWGFSFDYVNEVGVDNNEILPSDIKYTKIGTLLGKSDLDKFQELLTTINI